VPKPADLLRDLGDLDGDVVAVLVEAGDEAVEVGFEGGDEATLRPALGGLAEDVQRAAQRLKVTIVTNVLLLFLIISLRRVMVAPVATRPATQ